MQLATKELQSIAKDMQDVIKESTKIYKTTKGTLRKKVESICSNYEIEVIVDLTLPKNIAGQAHFNSINVAALSQLRHSFVAFHELAHTLFHLRIDTNKTTVEQELEADEFAKQLFLSIYGKANEWELVFLVRSIEFIKANYQ